MAESTPRNYTAEEKKRYEQGVADYEATLKSEEKSYSVSLGRRRAVYAKFKIEEKALALQRAKEILDAESKIIDERQKREIAATKQQMHQELSLVTGKNKAADIQRQKIREECERKIDEITSRHEQMRAREQEKYAAVEMEHMYAILGAQKKIAEVSALYVQNMQHRVSIQDALKRNSDDIADADKAHLEALSGLINLTSRAAEYAESQMLPIRDRIQILSDELTVLQDRQITLSVNDDEWLDVQQAIELVSAEMDELKEKSETTFISEYVTAAKTDAAESLTELINSVKKRSEIREFGAFKGTVVPIKSGNAERQDIADKAASTFDVKTYLDGMQSDIEEDKKLLGTLVDARAETDASIDPDLFAALNESIASLEGIISDKTAKTVTIDDKNKPNELGKILAAQQASLKVENKKNELEKRRTDSALKKEEEKYYKEGGGNAIDRKLRMIDKAEKSEQAAKEHNAQIADHMEQAFRSALNDLSKMIDNSVDSFFEYQASIEGRLQGSGESYKDLLKTVSSKVAVSPFVSQKDVVANIKSLVETGVSYNIELRAFLQTVSEDIVATFDAFDANMMRLIRMQQADSTAARLGMEATLTKIFNQQFKDTSYLANSISDSVSGAILEASSLLSHQNSLEFEYAVQKWLGSMYSVGVSDSTVNRIAQGLNYLGTGNVEALGGDESLQNLFAMSAARAGLPYSEMLTNGLNAEDTNKLLRSMVEYLREIASNSDNNQVTKAAYSNIFGISVADMTALNNLYDENSATLNFLTNSTLSWSNALLETENQISQIGKRVHISQMIDTIVDNISSATSTGIGSNALLYGTWKALNIVNDLTGGIKIPGIQFAGFGLSSELNILEIAKAGIAGLGFLGGLIGGLGSGGGIGGMDKLSSWGYEEQTARGKGRKAITGGVSSGFSQSEELSGVGSGSGDDVKTTSTQQANDEASETGGVTSEEMEEGKEVPQKTLEALDNGNTTVVEEIEALHAVTMTGFPTIEALLGNISDLLALDRTFKTVSAGMDTLTTLLSPNRVFYMINPTTITGESMSNVIKYDEATKSVLYDIAGNYESISEDSIDIALENSKITSNLSSVMSELGLSATSIVDTASIMGYTVQSAIESSNNYVRSQLVDNLSNEISNSFRAMTTGVTTTIGGTGTIPTTDEVDDSGEGTSSGVTNATGVTSPAPSGSSGDDIKNIATAITALHSYIVTEKSALNVTVSNNDNMKVSLNDITTVTDPLKTVFREAVTAAISATISGEEDDESLADRIAAAITSSPLDVRVTNDYFDTILENKAFDV